MHKKEYVRKMFAGISKHYDFLNHLLSMGRDVYWRRFAVSKLPAGLILDVCSGTCDVALEVSETGRSRVIASDFCIEMLRFCAMKLNGRRVNNIYCIQSDAENLSFKDCTFEGSIAAFGIRNVSDIRKALSEMRRVVKKGGKVVIVEFSKPSNPIFWPIYSIYFQKILPIIGAVISKKTGPYSYLPSSVLAFPKRNEFVRLMKASGLTAIEYYDLTFGIVTVYTGTK